jgi:hypothetical protein
MRTTFANFLKSTAFAVNSGCSSKNGMIRRLQITEGTHRVSVHGLSVIVVTVIATDLSAPEEPLHSMQNIGALLALDHRERRLNLPACTARAIPEDRNAEAAFAVDEADDPLRETWPFLLIVRTGRIFTTHVHTLRNRCNNMNEYRRIHGVPSI